MTENIKEHQTKIMKLQNMTLKMKTSLESFKQKQGSVNSKTGQWKLSNQKRIKKE